MTTLILNHSEWKRLRQRISDDYGQTTVMLSWRLKETLGFTIRTHSGKNSLTNVYEYDTRLDFVSQDALTFFNLKYGCRDGQ
jgi:hypothetical protein